jgi:ribosomal protein L22
MSPNPTSPDAEDADVVEATEATDATDAAPEVTPTDADAAPARKPSRTRAKAKDETAAKGTDETAAKAKGDKPAKAKAKDDKAKAKDATAATAGASAGKPEKGTEVAAKPKARPARAGGGAPIVMARARYVRTSPRKARMVCDHLRGKSVPEARAMLAYTQRGVARDWSKLLESAVANAAHNHELPEDDLVVREAYADAGPTIKRFRPRALGRATPILKRTSHLTIKLTVGS